MNNIAVDYSGDRIEGQRVHNFQEQHNENDPVLNITHRV